SEQALAVAAQKVDLVPAAFLKHCAEIPDRVRFRHLRNEFGQQMRLGSRPIEHFIAAEHDLFEQYLLRAEHEFQRILVCVGKSRSRISRAQRIDRGSMSIQLESSTMTASDLFFLHDTWSSTAEH